MAYRSDTRSPGTKLLLAILIGMALTIPLFVSWFLTYDRQTQAETARTSIAEGWGGPQRFAGPMLVVPYADQTTETVTENGRQVTRTSDITRELFVAPRQLELTSTVTPEVRNRAIYEIVVYEAANSGKAVFALPDDLARYGIAREKLDLTRAEIRIGLADPRGVAANNRVVVDGRPVELQPGKGLSVTGGAGFFGWVDASALGQRPLAVDFSFGFRGNETVGFHPRGGQTKWTLNSSWPHPSFGGGFLPTKRDVRGDGFGATWEISNLALGRAIVSLDDNTGPAGSGTVVTTTSDGRGETTTTEGALANVSLMQPVDLYDQVERAQKYGFLFIGFTFLALLMFDVIGGVRVSAVEYLLVGAGLILFFVLLLAFAEVIGFTPAYLVASAAIVGLLTAYSAAVLKSWRRAAFIGGLLVALYMVLFVLLSLEAYSLLIGALLLFAALAAVMYFTRGVDWGGKTGTADEPAIEPARPPAAIAS